MFIRPCYKRKNGKRHAYWALVESYRTDRGPRQRVVAYLGKLKQSERLGVKQAAEGNKKSPYKQLLLFDHEEKSESEWVEVDTTRVRVENQLEFGGAWLSLELIRQLKLVQAAHGASGKKKSLTVASARSWQRTPGQPVSTKLM